MKSYQKVNALGKKEVEGILDGNVIVEEKLDGSQFRIEINTDGKISCGSHHLELSMVDSMFKLGTSCAEFVFKGMTVEKPITIFAEYFAKPKQNQIPYMRMPRNSFVVFDVMVGDEYLSREQKEEFCFMWNVECIPLLWRGSGAELTEEVQQKLLKSTSCLGHQPGYDRVEGIVIKNYGKKFNVAEGHSLHGHFMSAKIVNDTFKEVKKIKSPSGNKLEELKESLKSTARWEKAVQNLTEIGVLKNDMSDIGLVIRRVMEDIMDEEKESIKEQLLSIYKKDILQHATNGLATWYQTEKLK